jgi:hypothetical protein
MAKKSKGTEPPVRKSFLIFGGIIVAVAVLGFVVSTFVLGGGGGGGEEPAPATSSAPVPNTGAPGSDGVPATGGATNKFPKNELKPGGRNPFSAKGGGATVAASTASAPSAAAAEETKAHTWQLLDLKSDEATILVDGKKNIVKVGEEVIDGYTFNSVTGKCITVKGNSVFGLCPGAQPITL